MYLCIVLFTVAIKNTCVRAAEHELLSGCTSEQKAAEVLGFNEVTWDDLSGEETQPDSWSTHWSELTRRERAAAAILGYNQVTWDNESGNEAKPPSVSKSWSQLTTCGKRSSVHGAVCKLKCCALLGAGYHTAL